MTSEYIAILTAIVDKVEPQIKDWDLSIVAIIVSLVSLYFSNANNKINLEATYIDQIFQNYMLIKIPEGRKQITHSNGEVKGTDNLIETLNEMRQDSLYYSYQDKKFYEELNRGLQDLEDYLVNQGDKNISNEEFSDFITTISKYLSNIYNLIHDKYLGKTKIRTLINFFRKKWYWIMIAILIIIIGYQHFTPHA